jgi:hypothetical protein
MTLSEYEGTWIMCKDPSGTDVKPVYVEERITVAPFRLIRQQPEKQQQEK